MVHNPDAIEIKRYAYSEWEPLPDGVIVNVDALTGASELAESGDGCVVREPLYSARYKIQGAWREVVRYVEYEKATDETIDSQRQFVLDNPGFRYDYNDLRALFPLAPINDNFGIKAEDVQARIETLRGGTGEAQP